MTRIAVFGYGSLVSRASIAETLGHEAPPPIPARLEGWVRRWSIARHNERHEKTFERLDGEPFEHVLGLNIERAPHADPDEWVNGGLIEVTGDALDRLDLREVRYNRVEVTDAVRMEDGTHGTFDQVVAFEAKPEFYAPEPPPRSITIAAYVRACEEAFAELGPGEAHRFAATTPMAATQAEVRLVGDSIPAGNPRAW